jgi:hypothetical protein
MKRKGKWIRQKTQTGLKTNNLWHESVITQRGKKYNIKNEEKESKILFQ